ncbi:hypothetical protein GQ54DRAFT_116765 [Martensiomyces pterosporus]|nr:hypothetical protein GQ54DRAFT_116765 [Martensiomyces pterosporus]
MQSLPAPVNQALLLRSQIQRPQPHFYRYCRHCRHLFCIRLTLCTCWPLGVLCNAKTNCELVPCASFSVRKSTCVDAPHVKLRTQCSINNCIELEVSSGRRNEPSRRTIEM